MSESRWNSQMYQLLRDAMCKRAWGESLDICDSSDLLDQLAPSFAEAIAAVDDRGEVAGILIDLHRRCSSSDSELVATLYNACRWSGSTSAFRKACERAIRQVGVSVIQLLLDTLEDEVHEEATVGLLVHTCRFAVSGIARADTRLEVLRAAYARALRVTNDPAVAAILQEGVRSAGQHRGGEAAEALLDYYCEAIENDYPWPLLKELVVSLPRSNRTADGYQAALDTLLLILREEIAEEGADFLWEDYKRDLSELESDYVEVLLEMYERAIHAVTDPEKLILPLFAVCDHIADAGDDVSFWLPNRVQVSQACMDAIRAARGPAAAREVIADAVEHAIQDCGDPWDVLSDAFRDVMKRASDEAGWQMAAVLVSASQEAMRKVLSGALASADRVIQDPERIVDLLLEAEEEERAFFAFRQAQEATEGDRQRAVECLAETLSEREPGGDRPSSAGEPLDIPLFRAFMVASTALSDPTTAANVLATVHMATETTEYDIDIEHAVSAFAQVVATLDDPLAETEVMYDAYVAAIAHGNDPSLAVETLLEAVKEAIAQSDEPVTVIEVILNGLSVQPSGWPPPTPAWLIPE